MSDLSSQLNTSDLADRYIQRNMNSEYLNLQIEKSRQRNLLYSEILQVIRRSENLTEIFAAITTKLLNSLHAVHVSIYKLDTSPDLQQRGEGIIIAEAKANYCETCSDIQIANILNEKHDWGEGETGTIIDRYTAGITNCDLNLGELFAGKSYFLVPIILPEINRDRPLWGFLTLYGCTVLDSTSSWHQDDVLMLQQIATQIEILLQKQQHQILSRELEEQSRAYETLYRWTQRYRSLVEQIPSISYISPLTNNSELSYISPQLKDLLGIPASEWNAGFFNSWAEYVHPDDRDRVLREVIKTIETGEPFCCEYRFITLEGKIVWVRDTARIGLATDGKTKVLRGSAFDISDRKETELRFKGIFNNTFQFTGLLSIDGTLLEANQTALDFSGVTRDQVIDKPFWEAYWFSISEDTKTRLRESVKRAAQGEFIRYEIDSYGAGQVVITIDFSIRPLKNESGQVVLLIPEGRDISGNKAIENALRKSELMLAKAQKIAKLGNWEWDVVNDEITWSKGLFHIFGRDPELGTPSYEELLSLYVKEDQEKHNQAVQRAIRTGEAYYMELQIRQDGNSCKYIEAIGDAEYDSSGKVVRLCGTVQDISDRKAIEAKLLQSKALLQLTIENAPIGIATFDLEGKFLNVNQSLCQIYGYAAEELLSMTATEITHLDSIDKALTAFNALVGNIAQNFRLEKQYIHKDGHVIDAISQVSLIRDDQGNPLQFIANVEDVTERKQTEAKLESARIAEAANQAKSEFLAVMSHELRTPMNAVIGMTGLLLDTPLSPQQQQYVSMIRQGGEVLLSVINNILDFSRIESGHLEIEANPFKIQQCVEEVIDLMTSRITDKSLELFALIDVNVPQQIIGDYSRLRQILVNLASNAIKFTDKGEIVITVTSQLIDREANIYKLLFDVRDTGIGIAPEAIAKLFQAFKQANSSINRQYGGTGLGLVICKQLCEAMGGDISVESNLGKGSIFSFSIQAAIATDAVAIAPESSEKLLEKLRGKRILSVNTNPIYQQAIALYIQPWGMTIQGVGSATEALQLLMENNYDLILIDQYLDEASGLEFAKDIQDIFPDLHLVILNSAKDILEPNSIGRASNITKPITASRLFQAFTNIFMPQDHDLIKQDLILPKTDKIFKKQNYIQILVVEDNPINQQILSLMLEKIGYVGEFVGNGLEAINLLAKKSFDIIFMDIQMPVMDGLTATRNIRQEAHQHPWIIGLSANAFTESRDLALSAGMDDYLTKPLQIEDLSAALGKVPKISSLEIQYSSLDLKIIANLEKIIDKHNLTNLISDYLKHSKQGIAKMQEALKNGDLATIAAESHTLKGGSGAFGATYLCNICRDLQSLCHKIMENPDQISNESMKEVASLVHSIVEEYAHVSQAFYRSPNK